MEKIWISEGGVEISEKKSDGRKAIPQGMKNHEK
jgi:hypothetical protein